MKEQQYWIITMDANTSDCNTCITCWTNVAVGKQRDYLIAILNSQCILGKKSSVGEICLFVYGGPITQCVDDVLSEILLQRVLRRSEDN